MKIRIKIYFTSIFLMLQPLLIFGENKELSYSGAGGGGGPSVAIQKYFYEQFEPIQYLDQKKIIALELVENNEKKAFLIIHTQGGSLYQLQVK